jgi:hypothetical protein
MMKLERAGMAAAIAGLLMLSLAFAVGLAAPEGHAGEPEAAAYTTAIG